MPLACRCLCAVLLAGCVVNVDYGSGPYLCTKEPVCSDGYVCDDGVCVILGAIDGGADGSPRDANLAAPVVPAFAMPVLVTELSTANLNDDDASFTSDLLYVIFNSNRGGNADLYESTRSAIGASWSTPTPIAELNTPSGESTIAMTGDGLAVLFGSTRPGGLGDVDVYLATRANRTVAFSAPVLQVALSSPVEDAASWLADDLSTAVIHSRRGGGASDLYLARRQGGQFGVPTPIASVNTASAESSGRLAAGGLVLTFHSNRAGTEDLYAATRASVDDDFGAVQPIAGVNTDSIEEDAWLSDDLCTLFFSRSVVLGEGNIFEAKCLAP